ncbi:hypothetical protein HYW76_01350 [Candidatus Pacearchaeota archaeon]|nr:hypothetical protein [Candidatus Pacearchaeota archaeon]
MLNKKKIKEKLREKGIRIGKNVIDKFIVIEEGKINKDMEILRRELRIYGRKNLSKEDLEVLSEN